MDATKVLIIYPRYMPVHKIAREIIEKEAEVQEVAWETPSNACEETFKLIKDADAVLVRLCRIDEKLLNIAQKLKVISVHGAGVDNININIAAKRGVIITNTPMANVVSVAEFTIGLILCLARKIPTIYNAVRDRGWEIATTIELGNQIYGKTLGIIGCGKIGSLVAKRAKGLGMNVIVFDPYIPDQKARKMGINLTDLETLLKSSDFVTIHVPLTSETRHMIGEKELNKFKKEAFLINVSRGGVVDEMALYKALKEKRIAGAALDVMEMEPPDPNNPLLSLDNIIITPHIAGSTKESIIEMAKTAAEDIVRVLNGRPPKFPVNIQTI
jgi:D-3-phosphoglycerate dehydrogenase